MVTVQKEVNERFEEFIFNWQSNKYLLVGGYGSSKSYHAALKIVLKLLGEKRTALVVREVYETHKDSTYSLFVEIIDSLGRLDDTGKRKIAKGKIRPKESPYELRFSNGSKIIFKGMDKPAKLKSINNISLIWLEECSEIKYEGFKELLGRLRHPTLDLHIILTTNPVSQDNWTFLHFFYDDLEERFVLDDEDLYVKKTIQIGDTYYHHSTADDNMFLPQSYIDQLEEMKEYDPDLHRIARHGRFGVNGTLVLPQLRTASYDEVMVEIHNSKNIRYFNGLDFGFVESYNSLSKMAIDTEKQYLYVYGEYYEKGLTDPEILADLREHLELGEYKDGRVYGGERVTADNEPKSIAYYRKSGVNMVSARKGPNTRIQNTKKVKRFKKIIIADTCKNHIRELKTLTFKKDKNGKIIEDEFNIDPHTFSSIWYGIESYHVVDLKDDEQKKGDGTKRRPKRERRRRNG